MFRYMDYLGVIPTNTHNTHKEQAELESDCQLMELKVGLKQMENSL